MEETNESVESQESVNRNGLGWASLGAGLAGLSVMLGAFGAHSLKARLTEKKTRYLPHCHRLPRLPCIRPDLDRHINLLVASGYRGQAEPICNLDKCRDGIFLRKSLRAGV